MDWSPIIAAGWALFAAPAGALWPLARAAIVEWTTASQMGRIAAAAGRVAPRSLIEVGQSPAARAAIDGMVEAGAAKIVAALPAAVKAWALTGHRHRGCGQGRGRQVAGQAPMGQAAASIAAAIAAFLIEVGRILGVRQATQQIAADAEREVETARSAVAKAQAEAKPRATLSTRCGRRAVMRASCR